MIELSYSQIQELLNQIDGTEYPNMRIAVLRNITVEPIEPYLRYLAWKSGFTANVKFGEAVRSSDASTLVESTSAGRVKLRENDVVPRSSRWAL